MKEKENQQNFQRSLSNAHIQLIALGGTIGTGLFLGVGDSIQRSGTSVIITYIIVGAVLFLFMRALGELILSDVHKHSYIDFIDKYLGKRTALIIGYLYWITYLTLAMTEIIALGMYFQYWFTSLPLWLPGTVTIFALLAINLISVRFFGNLEFAFSILKIATIIGFVLLIGYMLITGQSTQYGNVSLSNIFDAKGMFAHGAKGFLEGFQMVIFAFVGIEMIGFTASEAKNPKKTMPKAINEMPIRIILFYVLAIIAVLLVVPWDKVATNSSPFVQALTATGIKNTGSFINLVVISAGVSSANTILYSSGRLLYSICYGKQGKFNKKFSQLSNRQLPQNALVLSALIIALAPLITLEIGEQAFNFVSATTTSMFLLIWLVMIITHLVYRKHVKSLNDFTMPLYPASDYLIITFFVAIILLLLIMPSFRIPMLTALVVFALLYVITGIMQDKKTEMAE